jgi:hypothetical protein
MLEGSGTGGADVSVCDITSTSSEPYVVLDTFGTGLKVIS